MDDIGPNKLRPTEDDDVLFSIAHGLRFDGKRRLHYADDHMARIAAAHLLKHLKQSGFVVMKKPEGPTPDASAQYRYRESPPKPEGSSS